MHLFNNYFTKQILMKSAYTAAALTKAASLFKPWYGGIASILMFHRITAERQQHSFFNKALEVTPEYLEQCILYLRKNKYSIVSLDAIYDMLLNSVIPSQRLAAFTFDDGYADNLHYALPVLKKHGVPFTVYVATSFPERSGILWWYLAEDLIRTKDSLSFQVDGVQYALSCRTVSSKAQAFTLLRNIILNAASAGHLLSIVQQIFTPYKVDLYRKTEELALTWQQLQILSREPGATIGAHTHNHLPMSRLSDLEAEREIVSSKQMLETKLDAEVRHFCYPFGSRHEAGQREFDIVNKQGYKTATTTRPGNIFASHAHALTALPRIMIDGNVGSNNIHFLDVAINIIPPLFKGLKI